MIAARITSMYGIFSVSAIIKATAPMTGGIICPPIEAVASTAPENVGVNPDRVISGMVN
jgi:hypothetical protein